MSRNDYDSNYYDNRGRPDAPTPLDQEDTSGGQRIPRTERVGENDETLPPDYMNQPGDIPTDEETVPPQRGGQQSEVDEGDTLPPKRKRRPLDSDEEELDITVYEKEEIPILGWLIVKESNFFQRGKMWPIGYGIKIGRDPNWAKIVIDDEKVSKEHARIVLKDGQFVLIDEESRNGTWVDGQEIKSRTIIVENQEIRLGRTTFVLKSL